PDVRGLPSPPRRSCDPSPRGPSRASACASSLVRALRVGHRGRRRGPRTLPPVWRLSRSSRRVPPPGPRVRPGAEGAISPVPRRLHREDLLLRLDLDVPGRPSLLQPVQDQPAGLLDCLQFGPEGVEFALSHRAPLILLFEFPFPAVELLFALDERSFLTATGFELF